MLRDVSVIAPSIQSVVKTLLEDYFGRLHLREILSRNHARILTIYLGILYRRVKQNLD